MKQSGRGGQKESRMSSHRRFRIFVLALPLLVAAREGSADAAPANSHAKRYGGGWECDRGYRDVSRSCVTIAVPPDAYLDSSGSGWQCNRGYARSEGACAKIALPANAFLHDNG